jgi:hypothetical protein
MSIACTRGIGLPGIRANPERVRVPGDPHEENSRRSASGPRLWVRRAVNVPADGGVIRASGSNPSACTANRAKFRSALADAAGNAHERARHPARSRRRAKGRPHAGSVGFRSSPSTCDLRVRLTKYQSAAITLRKLRSRIAARSDPKFTPVCKLYARGERPPQVRGASTMRESCGYVAR